MASRQIVRHVRACAAQTKSVRSFAAPSLSEARVHAEDTLWSFAAPSLSEARVHSEDSRPQVGSSTREGNPPSVPHFAQADILQAEASPASQAELLDSELFAESGGSLHPLQASYLELPSPPFRRDSGQVDAIKALLPIYDRLMQPLKVPAAPAPQQAKASSSGGGGLFSLFGGAKPKPQPAPKPKPAKPPAVAKGLYLHGSPGTGKTVMLDLFFRSLPDDFPARRLHWHEFIGQGMRYLSNFKKSDANDDLYARMAQDLVPRCRVLCLDELLVTHISEAIFVKQLFRALWARGTVVVTTSNYRHDDLYSGGFNRGEFLEFIPDLKDMCPLFDLDNPVDYRSIDVAPTGCFLTPISEATRAMLDAQFHSMVSAPEATELRIEGRPFPVPMSGVDAQGGRVARLTFDDLCGKARGRAEFAALATEFHTIFIDDIPKLNADLGAEFCRLVSLVDILYDKKCILYCTSELPMHEIWDMPENVNNVDEMWAWRRTRAKLTEMSSGKYTKMASLMRDHLVQARATAL